MKGGASNEAHLSTFERTEARRWRIANSYNDKGAKRKKATFVYNRYILSQRHDSAHVGVARFALLYTPSLKSQKNHTQHRPFVWP